MSQNDFESFFSQIADIEAKSNGDMSNISILSLYEQQAEAEAMRVKSRALSKNQKLV